ncbi:CCN family member 1-like isoform X1 [Pristis pectinata]|uniref:CCN family member 1-like isoform X1 n=1 Tax=Pristis pectinata TaxID=685728 RepID=UPI00223E2568|nr:CCN family member 1-like isoform X1 [Pristis pectinata]
MGFRWRRGRLGLGLGSRVQALASVNTTLWGALLLLGASSLAHEATCPLVCECPKPPACRPGVPLIQDGCGCCQVCAGQFNEMCSALRPCDRGLRCEQAAGSSADRGICRASTPGHPCTKNGKVYQHGESFRPNCRLQCTCEDGRVGCLALCPLHLPTPPVPCPDAHLVQVAGTCCKRWKCTTSYSKDWPQRDGKWKSRFDSVNEVVENRVAAKRSRGHFKARSFRGPGCTVKSTEWSQCSKTCSIGVSTRRSNNNTRCQLREEKRLCQTRPCAMLNDLAPKKGSGCLKTHKEKVPRPFTYEGCTSLKRYKPKYCGLCRDGRCCQPSETRTTKVRFHCPGAGTLVIPVVKIKRCECSRQSGGCAQLPPVSYDWKRSLQDPTEPQ